MVHVSDGMLSIGAFGRASLLSVKALRAYHAAGILVPARVDPRTGYRAYSSSQLVDAGVLRRLRQLDLPLDDVARVLRARDPEVTRAVLARHERAMQTRLAVIVDIVAELQAHAERPSALTPVFVRVEPARHALAVTGHTTEAEFSDFLGAAYAELDGACAASGAVRLGSSGALYPAELDPDDTEVVALVPIEAPVVIGTPGSRVHLVEVPRATVAVLTHEGGYATIDASYRALGAWVADHVEPLAEPVREWYAVSVGDTDDESAYRTEIAWPIHPDSHGTTKETT